MAETIGKLEAEAVAAMTRLDRMRASARRI